MGKKNGEPSSRYSLVIEWSDVDHLYIVSFPEWEQMGHYVNTHGKTYEQAARRGWKMLRFLLDATEEHERPKPILFDRHYTEEEKREWAH